MGGRAGRAGQILHVPGGGQAEQRCQRAARGGGGRAQAVPERQGGRFAGVVQPGRKGEARGVRQQRQGAAGLRVDDRHGLRVGGDEAAVRLVAGRPAQRVQALKEWSQEAPLLLARIGGCRRGSGGRGGGGGRWGPRAGRVHFFRFGWQCEVRSARTCQRAGRRHGGQAVREARRRRRGRQLCSQARRQRPVGHLGQHHQQGHQRLQAAPQRRDYKPLGIPRGRQPPGGGRRAPPAPAPGRPRPWPRAPDASRRPSHSEFISFKPGLRRTGGHVASRSAAAAASRCSAPQTSLCASQS